MKPIGFRLEEFWDAAFDDEAFDHLLRRLARAVDAQSFAAPWHYADGTATMLWQSGHWSDEQMAHYNDNFALSDIWKEATLRHWRPGRALDMANLVSDSEYTKSSLYNEFVRAVGDDTFRELSVPVESNGGVGVVAFHRGKSEEGFRPEAVRLLDQLAPHLAKVLALRGRSAGVQRATDSAHAALDTLGHAIFLVNGAGRILHANPASEELLEKSGALLARNGFLCAVPQHSERELKKAISAALSSNAPCASVVSVPLPAGGRIDLSIISLRSSTGRRDVLVTAPAPEGADQTLGHRLRNLHGLTRAEANLAARLAQGATPAEIAEARGVSLGTVRSQIKAVSVKLDCHRQIDIVAKVNALPPLRR